MSAPVLACSLTKACNCIQDGNCTCAPGHCHCNCGSTEGSKCEAKCCPSAEKCKCSSGGPCTCGDNCSCADCKCKSGCKRSDSHGGACTRT